MLQTTSKSFRHYSLPKGGVKGDVGSEKESMPIICMSSYGGKVFSNIFISIYVTRNGFRANGNINKVYRNLTGLYILSMGLSTVFCVEEKF